MHIPDGFLDNRLCLATGVVSALAVGGALRRLRPESEPELAPRMGLTAAYVFAAQMVNFPVAGGTSGHLLGAVLAAVLLGPHAASVAMAAVFLIQAFFFLDGGHTALGANILNMGLAGTYGGYAVYRALAGPTPNTRRCLWSAGAAAWAAVMLGAALTSVELALSGAVRHQVVFPAMLGVHALIGAGEAAITVGALALLWKVRPDLLTGRFSPGGEARDARWGWMAAAGLVLVGLLAPLASSFPDGLEAVAGHLGFESRAAEHPLLGGPFPDYTLPGLDAGWAPILVSLLGAGIMIAAVLLIVRSRRLVTGESSGMPRLDPRGKLAALLALVLTAVLLPPADAGKVGLLALFALGWVLAARVSARWLAGRALLLLPFLGLTALSLPGLRDSAQGLSFLGLVYLRAATSLLATAAFLATTSEAEVLAAMRAFRLPRALAETLAFALRYMRVLVEEGGRMLQARAARGAGAGTLALRAGGTGGIVGTLFLRSLERADRVSLAMAARGYSGQMPAEDRDGLAAADWGFLAGITLFLAGVWLWR